MSICNQTLSLDIEGLMYLKKIAFNLIIIALAAALSSNVAYSDDCPVGLPPLEDGAIEIISFNKEHSRTLQSTVTMLNKNHYEKICTDCDESIEIITNALSDIS